MCERHYRRWKKNDGNTDAPVYIDNLSRYEVDKNGCWVWTGVLFPNGYGKTSKSIHGTTIAHRVFYIEHVGPIPESADVDHLCHTHSDPPCEDRGEGCPHRRCVNPAHMEPVSHGQNIQRGWDLRKVCHNGHDLTLPGATKDGGAACVQCWRDRYRAGGQRYRDRKKNSA